MTSTFAPGTPASPDGAGPTPAKGKVAVPSEWPQEELERVRACPVCGDSSRVVLHDGLTDKVFRCAPGTWTLHVCQGCGSAYLDPRPSVESMGMAYAQYYTHAKPSEHRQPASRLSRFKRAALHGYLNRRHGYQLHTSSYFGGLLVSFSPRHSVAADFAVRHMKYCPERNRLLDVGCGNGDFVKFMRELHWNAEGLDPDSAATARAEAFGLTVHREFPNGSGCAETAYDAITMNHVIEHLHDPLDSLNHCHRLLRPGGVLWIATPNLSSMGHRYFGSNWSGLDSPRHLVLFRRASLIGLLKQVGFKNFRFTGNRGSRRRFCESEAIQSGKEVASGNLPCTIRTRLLAKWADIVSSINPDVSEEIVVIAAK